MTIDRVPSQMGRSTIHPLTHIYPCINIYLQSTTSKDDGNMYSATLQILNVTVEDAGKYKVTAKNELGESNATISLNFDSKYLATTNLSCLELLIVESHP